MSGIDAFILTSDRTTRPLTPTILETELEAISAALREPALAPPRLIMSRNTYRQFRRMIHETLRFNGPHYIGKRKFRFVQTPRGVKITPWKGRRHAL